MKRIVSILISFAIILSLCFSVCAKENDGFVAQSEPITFKNYMDNNSSGGGESNQVQYSLLDAAAVNRLKNALISAADNVESVINISSENIAVPITGMRENIGAGDYDYNSYTGKYVRNGNRTGNYEIMLNDGDIKNVFSELYYGNEFFFHVSSFGYSYNMPYEVSSDFGTESTTILSMAIYYKMSKSEYNTAKSFCISKMDDIISRMDDDFTTIDKLLFIHDYFVENFSYQTDDTDANMYRFFTYNGGVCQSYTLAYMGILNRLGIDNTVAISDPGNHIWNIAKLEDNNYYHIDCTQDDPLFIEYDLPGYVKHDLFLLSDSGLLYADSLSYSPSHIDWYTIPFLNETVVCDNTRFDDADWRNTIGRFCLIGDNWYAISPTLPTNVYSFSKGTLGNTTLVNTFISEKYGLSESYDWDLRGVVQLGTMICFSDLFEIVTYDVLSDRFETVLFAGYEDYIYGCFDTKNGQLGYYYDAYFLQEGTPDQTENLGVGDIDRDGDIDAADLTYVVSVIRKEENQIYNYYFADVNFDGRVNIVDLVKYKKYLSTLS